MNSKLHKRQWLLLPALLSVCTAVHSQQVQQLTQYMLNDYIYNPAVAGSRESFRVNMHYRNQWTGMSGAPETFVLSAFGPGKDGKTGWGGYLFSDKAGPIGRTGIQLSYAYHVQTGAATKLAFGLSAGLQQFRFNATDLVIHDPGDHVFTQGTTSATVPDVNAGIYLYGEQYYIGVAAHQILHNRLNLYDDATGSLRGHYFITTGYTIHAGEDMDIEPALQLKLAGPVPLQFDLGARLIYRKSFWLGSMYRTQDAVNLMFGYEHNERLMLGYSYDITLSPLKNHGSGTQEIVLGYYFGKQKSGKTQAQ